MKRFTLFLAATLALTAATPSWSQDEFDVVRNWTAQKRGADANVFTPTDLRAGEVYSVTVYDAAPLNKQSLEAWLRKFGGAVGDKPGALAKELNITTSAQTASGIGYYNGPNGSSLGAMFLATSLDSGQTVSAMRTLFSGKEVLDRYAAGNRELMQLTVAAAREAAGDNFIVIPDEVSAKIKPGGALVPGVYAGSTTQNGAVTANYRVYLYANGESRVTDSKDADLKGSYGSILGVGKYKYYGASGQLNLDRFDEISNGNQGDKYAFYGRDSAGKAMIVAGNKRLDERTVLVYDGQPTKRPSPATIKAREIEDARFKFVVPPGKGVPMAQIAAVVNNYVVQFNGMSSNITNDTFLLLRDGTIYNQLPVAPDQFDATKSRANEPKNWGKWRAKGAGYEVSWNGKPYEKLPGDKVVPAVAGAKLNGRFGAVRSYSYGFGGSYSYWGASFTPAGRFSKDSRGGSSTNTAGIEGVPTVTTGYDENGSAVIGQSDGVGISSIRKKNPNGDREGDYSVSGYTMTLRFDNGTVERIPFFFRRADRKAILFEGDILDVSVTN